MGTIILAIVEGPSDESYTEIKKYENVASNMNNFLKEFNLI